MKHRFRTQFRILTVVQVCLLAVTLCMLLLTLFKTTHIAVPVVLTGIVLLQIFGLIRSVQAHVDTLEDFFGSRNFCAPWIHMRLPRWEATRRFPSMCD